ncbi:MAG: hypothetical protein CVT75_02145 [Alphaproteobacteria bacterium HGW-Alphaproteobacteria-14]|nr:MAG: hypothetical protein CVT75_02145 [Alphaproteobacteria bacterium HGW-Alphaproteobacteria-14]
MALRADIDPIRQTRIHPDFPGFAGRIDWQKYGWPDLIPAPANARQAIIDVLLTIAALTPNPPLAH